MTRFLFYDIETSGLSPAFDQVLTFACIQTDEALVELAREVVTVKLRPDIVPSPGAFLTHGLTQQELAGGICEYPAALKIHQLFNTPDTVSIGYNSLGFDDEFLRFMFYRNLLDPYSHQYANGCGRMDMLPVAALYWLFCPDALSWPVLDNGKPTLKLEHICRENRFEVSGRAHEAMADVEALLSLSQKFRREKKIWDYVLGFFDKQTDRQRIQALDGPGSLVQTGIIPGDFKLGLMVSVSFGAKCNYLAPVLYLGRSEPYRNQSLWLRLDLPDLLARTDEENGFYDVFVTRKRPGDQLFVLPCLERFWKRLSPEAVAACHGNLERIQADLGRFERTAAFHRAYKYPDIPDVDLDADLYQGGFFSSTEKREIVSFHQEIARFLDGPPAGEVGYGLCDRLKSPRIKALAGRILSRNFGADISENNELSDHLMRLSGQKDTPGVKGYKNDEKYTCAQAMAELGEIESGDDSSLDVRQEEQLCWLKSYIQKMAADLSLSG